MRTTITCLSGSLLLLAACAAPHRVNHPVIIDYGDWGLLAAGRLARTLDHTPLGIAVSERAASVDPTRRIVVQSVGDANDYFCAICRSFGIAPEQRCDGAIVVSDSEALRRAVWAYAHATDHWVTITADNLANVQTPAYKRIEFLRTVAGASTSTPVDGGPSPSAHTTRRDFTAGPVDTTGRSLDLLIEGDGFFQVMFIVNGRETIGFTRKGMFSRNVGGNLILFDDRGVTLYPPISIPQEAIEVSIARDGTVLSRLAKDATLREIGSIQLARFDDPGKLLGVRPGVFAETQGAGSPIVGVPHTNGLGAIVQGTIEMSNVNPILEMMELDRARCGRWLASQLVQELYRPSEPATRNAEWPDRSASDVRPVLHTVAQSPYAAGVTRDALCCAPQYGHTPSICGKDARVERTRPGG